MLDIKTVEKRMKDAKITLRSLSERKELKVTIPKKALMGYCNETIIFCEMVLVLLKKKTTNDSYNPICFGKYEEGKNACFQCSWRHPCLERQNKEKLSGQEEDCGDTRLMRLGPM